MPKDAGIAKVLVIGSGPIVIGQAAEFDYAGTQACLALKEEGCRVILVNPNPATIMTDERVADSVYFEPLTADSVAAIIAKERPDGLLATMGGQTGLNLAYALHQQGVLQQYQVKLLGTDIEGIMKGEDREAFRSLMHELHEPVPASETIESVEGAVQFAAVAGYPLIVRPAYTLGGSGGGFADNEGELTALVAGGLDASPIQQCLLEKSIAGLQEIEYEMMRDAHDTCLTVCDMENVDPVGVHTGDSVVVAPSQTLTSAGSQRLRQVAVKIVRALGIVGGCNIQFALDPDSGDYFLIEVNPRVSRSSALASKATGYPIAKVAAKLSLGYDLDELVDEQSGEAYAHHEPVFDNVVVKFPRWPFDKFPEADRTLGTQMKATGEVMAIEDHFPSAFQKALRSLEWNTIGLTDPQIAQWPPDELWESMTKASDRRYLVILELMRRGVSAQSIHEQTNIMPFYLDHFDKLIQLEEEAKALDFEEVAASQLIKLKRYGFSDEGLADIWGVSFSTVRAKQKDQGIQPVYKSVQAGETEMKTAYYYSSWGGKNHGHSGSDRSDEKRAGAAKSPSKKMLVLGSGPIRIGQGIEFDYGSVHAVLALQEQGYETILINNNPETVSTDYTLADRLYFEPLALEDVLNVIAFEQVEGVVAQVGGQTAIGLVEGLEKAGVPILGSSHQVIDELEDRDLFYQWMEHLHISHIPGLTATDGHDLLEKADAMGFPVLLRPSYVIGGRGMVILSTQEQLKDYRARSLSDISYPILIDDYVPGTEAEVDVVSDGFDVVIPGLIEHVEKAGVHSGDSIAVTPSFSLSEQVKEAIVSYTKRIARQMNLIGIFNIQFVIENEQVKVLEVNPRASRTVPMLSKVTGVDMIDLAVKVMLGTPLASLERSTGLLPERLYYTVKKPVFSTEKLPGVAEDLGPEMKSTGELIALGETVEEAMQEDGSQNAEPHSIQEWHDLRERSLIH